MSRNKLVLFDWGGVFEVQGEINMGCVEFFTEIARQLGVSVYSDEFYLKVKEYLETKDFLDIIYDGSDVALDNNIRKILNIFGVEDSFENISKYKRYFLINSLNVPTNTELVEYAHSLKGRCEIGLLSNCTILEKYKQDIDVTRSDFDYIFCPNSINCV